MAEVQNKMLYIRFPLSYIRDMLVDKKKGVEKMILYGYSLVAEKSDINEWNAYKQIMYCFYGYQSRYDEEPLDKRNGLPYGIWNKITNYVRYEQLFIDEDRFGFEGTGQLDIDYEIGQLMKIGERDQELHEMVLDYHRVRQTADLFSLKINDYDTIFKEYRKYRAHNSKKTRMVSVKLSLLLEYLFNNKTEYQIMLFAAYMGVRAIIGKDSLKQTTKSYIIANMFGCMNELELQTMLVAPGNEQIWMLHKKYTTRKMFDRITTDLKEKNFIPEWLPYGKAGTFVSCKLNHKQFVKEVAKILDGNGKKQNVTRLSAKDYRRATKFEVEEVRNHATG